MLVRSVIWESLGRFFTHAANIIFTIFLARILTPGDYGLVAIALSIVVIIESLIENGFSLALIQKKRINAIDYSTIFFLQVVLSGFVFAGLVVASGSLAAFMGRGELESLIQVLSLSIVVVAFYNVLKTRLLRLLRFQTVVTVEMLSSFWAGVIAVIMAYKGCGYWALVVQYLFAKLLALIIFWLRFPIKIEGFSWLSLKRLSHFGLFSSLAALIRNISNQLDSLVLAKLFGPDVVGLYSRAKSLRDLVVNYSGGALGRVFFSFSSRSRVEKLGDVYFSSVEVIAMVSALLSGLVFVSSHELVELVFGSQWIAAVGMLKFLILADGILKPIGAVMISALAGLGYAKLDFYTVLLKRSAWFLCLYLLWVYGMDVFLWLLIVHSIFVYIVDALALYYAAGYKVTKQIINAFKALLVFGCCCAIVEVFGGGDYSVLASLVVNSVLYCFLYVVFGFFVFRAKFVSFFQN